MTFWLLLVTPDSTCFDGEVLSVVCPGPVGYFGVMARHQPMDAAVGTGILKVETAGRHLFFVVDGGVAEVHEGRMTICADLVMPASDAADAEVKVEELKLVPGRR
jgi:F-type H+-transporting ATPase subunit epsilon